MRRLVALALILLSTSRAWALTADSADDVCAPAADPCVVTQDIDIVDGATLDFGTRTLQIGPGGVLDTNTGFATVSCGRFLTDAGPTAALKVRGASGLGGIDGGSLTINVLRRCSLDNTRTCVGESNCDFGACTSKVCSLDANLTCTSDTNCDLGTCNTGGRCTNNNNRVCEGDGDCQLGTCTVNVCSANRTAECSNNADCNFGTCTVGTGTFEILRPTNGNGNTAGSLLLRAAGDITIGAPVAFNSTNVDNDGGTVDIESGLGSVTVNSPIEAQGGGFATGGDICLIAGLDVNVNGIVDGTGGDFDGGFIEVSAGRDVVIEQPVRANSNNGGGFGGDLAVNANNDITLSAPATLETNGHFASVDNFGGDGGTIEVSADQTLSIQASVALTSNGAKPDGFGGEIVLFSGAQATMAGSASARTDDAAPQGAGGNIDIEATGGLNFPAGALLDARGAQNGGGAVTILTDGGMTFGGTIDARSSNGGTGDSVDLDIGGPVTMTGAVRISGTASGQVNGQVDFEFCVLTMQSGALIENVGPFGRNILRARERATIQSGASILANAQSGSNRIIYRDPAKPPVVSGTVTPAAAPNDINEFLTGCPVCGNNELDGGETCEDGNTNSGDGCSADCQDEACIAQTPGYPEVSLCSDGNGCTVDTCESSNCQHVTSCDDAIDCTTDSCNAQSQCVNVANHGACNDNNPCTNDICSLSARECVSVNNTDVCDDALACTQDDRCAGGVCAGADTCPTGETCNPESGQCDVGGVCGNNIIDDTEDCDDGDAVWVAGESCDAECGRVACGDPDNNGTGTASDALFVLRTAVGSGSCDACVCNVDNSTGTPVTAVDSLRVLRKAVGVNVELSCPVCS
jgi:cysteine-rich repeat protein